MQHGQEGHESSLVGLAHTNVEPKPVELHEVVEVILT